MQITDKLLFEKFQRLANSVKQDFARKGIVVPTRLPDGNVQIGSYIIVKKHGAYYLKDKRGNIVEGPINLPQTAIILANNMTLGRFTDNSLINSDKWYGYKEFEEQVSRHSADVALKKKDVDKADLSLYKASLAQTQKLEYKKTVQLRFDKLCRLT